jgi:CheY-like chemotaxis protein
MRAAATTPPDKAIANPGFDVVVVEDDAVIREQLADIFADDGLRVTTARDGEEALAVLESEPVRVVVSDLMMPRMNGWDLVRALRATEKLANLPVLFITAVTNAHRVPAGPVFLKPLDVDSLLRAVKIHAGRLT